MKRKYDPSGPDVNGWKQDATNKNLGAYNSPAFKKACEAVGIPVTTRQAAKFAKKRGLAYTQGRF